MIDTSEITVRGRTNIRRGKLFKPEFVPSKAKPKPTLIDKDIPLRINIPNSIAVAPAGILEDDYFELTVLRIFQYFDIEPDWAGNMWIVGTSRTGGVNGSPTNGLNPNRTSELVQVLPKLSDGSFDTDNIPGLVYAGFRVYYYAEYGQVNFSNGILSNSCYKYNGQYCFYPSGSSYFSQGQYFQLDDVISSSVYPRKPNYKDLITGYYLDKRIKHDNPLIIPTFTEDVSIGYYRQNKLEPIPDLTSIDWFTYNFKVVKDKPIHIPIIDVVLGTLVVLKGSSAFTTALAAIDVDPKLYPVGLKGCEASLISAWQGLRGANIFAPPEPVHNFIIITSRRVSRSTEISRTYRCSPALNNHWGNQLKTTQPRIFQSYYDFVSAEWIVHPMFTVNHERAYNWHVAKQTQGVGTLTMDSPRTIEIHTALEAGKFAINSIDKTKPRIPTLGHLIEKISFLLGYRPEDDGSFDVDKEKSRLRKVISERETIDQKKIGVNNFGSDGMILKRLSNRFDRDKIVADECVIIQDVLQLISEYHDQLNLAVGIQESSAIEIKEEDNISRYPNQLAVLIELLNLASSNHNMIRANLISSMVTQGQTSEIIGGLGLPSVTKTIPIKIDGKTKDLPYKGIAPHRSISQEVATCTANVGIILGQII